MSDEPLTATPYKGLMPYTEEDAPFFFGRDAEREIIIANLMASRLTLLYGPSGVGKSSVLRAGVAHHLRRLSRENLDESGSPQFAVVVFNSWRDDPVAGLNAAVKDAALRALADEPGEPVPLTDSLVDTFRAWTQRIGGELLIILDQFEEYFLYHGQEQGAQSFAEQFPRVVNSPDLNVNFLISIRDDALAKLDRFQGPIPTLFANRLGVDHLDRSAARDAIEKPITQFNRLYAAGRQRVEIEPELVDAVLDQVKTGEVTVGETGRGVIKGQTSEAQIETPYLQLVMNRLWEEEVRSGSYTLRLKTLETLGGAQRIVRTHLDAAMNTLPRDEQDIAARVFHYLVTPSGTKIAHTIPDLAGYAELSREKLFPVMERLSSGDIRILRGVAPPPDKSDEPRYEIFHDVLAPAILDWRRRYALEQQKRRSARIYSGLLGLVVLILVAGAVFVVYGVIQHRKAAESSTLKHILGEEAEKDRKELTATYAAQAEFQKPLDILVKLHSENAEERSQAIGDLKILARDNKLPRELVPTVIASIEKSDPAKARETQKYLDEVLKSPLDTSGQSDSSTLPVRIFIHIRDDQPQQREQAAQVKSELEDKGYIVPGIQRVSNAPLNTELRFFRRNDNNKADEISQSLGDMNVQTKYVPGYENSTIVQPHQFEFWFGAPKKSTQPATPSATDAQKAADGQAGGSPKQTDESWVVVIGSFGKKTPLAKQKADELTALVKKRGYPARLIDTDGSEFPLLAKNLWAVVMGPYSKDEGRTKAKEVGSLGAGPAFAKQGR